MHFSSVTSKRHCLCFLAETLHRKTAELLHRKRLKLIELQHRKTPNPLQAFFQSHARLRGHTFGTQHCNHLNCAGLHGKQARAVSQDVKTPLCGPSQGIRREILHILRIQPCSS